MTDKPQAEALKPYPCDALERLGLAIEAAMPSHIVLAPSQLNRMAEAALQVRATLEPSEAMVAWVAEDICAADGFKWSSLAPKTLGELDLRDTYRVRARAAIRAIIKKLETSRD